MIWTILAVAAVVATKLVTALRLKDLKAKLESIQPDIDELRYKVVEGLVAYSRGLNPRDHPES